MSILFPPYSLLSTLTMALFQGRISRFFSVLVNYGQTTCSSQQAAHVCQSVPHIKPFSIVEQLQEHGVPSSLIQLHPWLLSDNWKTIQPRIEQLRRIGIDELTVPLLKLPVKRLEMVADKWVADAERFRNTATRNRLVYLAMLLDSTPEEVAQDAVRHPAILTLELNRIERVLKLLLANCITMEAVKNDLWILQHNEDIIRDRFLRASETRLPAIKLWMLRCPESTFDNAIEKWNQTRAILHDHEDSVGYLSERLNCSREYTMFVVKRNPRLLTINAPKLKLVLDFLYANGFNSAVICLQPRVLSCSVTTLKRRLEELQKFDYTPKNLDTLCLSAKRYEKFRAKLQDARRTTSHQEA